MFVSETAYHRRRQKAGSDIETPVSSALQRQLVTESDSGIDVAAACAKAAHRIANRAIGKGG